MEKFKLSKKKIWSQNIIIQNQNQLFEYKYVICSKSCNMVEWEMRENRKTQCEGGPIECCIRICKLFNEIYSKE